MAEVDFAETKTLSAHFGSAAEQLDLRPQDATISPSLQYGSIGLICLPRDVVVRQTCHQWHHHHHVTSWTSSRGGGGHARCAAGAPSAPTGTPPSPHILLDGRTDYDPPSLPFPPSPSFPIPYSIPARRSVWTTASTTERGSRLVLSDYQ